MDLNFIVDENYLACLILYRKMHNESESITNIKKSYEKNNGYIKLINSTFYNPLVYLQDEKVINVINEFKNTNEFKKIYKDTISYCSYLKELWDDNKEKINKYLNKVLKISININPIVYVSHPDANAGYSYNNYIVWGHYKGLEDPSYNMTYLVHETVHLLLPFKENETEEECNIKHSIIELISDCELQSILKGYSTYNGGHDYLSEYKNNIYPYWLNYLGLNNEQILDKSKNDNIELTEINSDLSNMNINQFIEYIYKIYKNERVR